MKPATQIETPYRGRLFNVQVLAWPENGGIVRREVVRHPGAVVIVPVVDEFRLLMIRNHRIAVDQRLWEFPAGKLEPSEPPEVAARRELQEETGYDSRQIRKLGEFYTSPGLTDELMRVFVAEQLRHVGQQLEAGEDIEVCDVVLDDALAMVHDGRLRDGKSIAALLMWHSQLTPARRRP